MRQLRHPFSGAVYEVDGNEVRVTKGGVTGLFTADGRWLSGALRTADPELCRWVGNPLLRETQGSPGNSRYANPSANSSADAFAGGAT